MKNYLFAFALAAVTCLTIASCSKESKTTDAASGDHWGTAVFERGAPIRIGFSGPLTGESASHGIDISQGAMLAIADVNTQPLDGWTFELVKQDDTGTPEGGAAVANRYISDPSIVAIAGHVLSGSTEAAIPIYDKAGYPMLSPSATNPSLTKMGSKVFNRIPFTDDEQGAKAAAYLHNKLNAKRIAIMHDGGAYGQGLAGVVRNEFKKLGGEVVSYEAVTPGETDYSALLSAAAAKKPDVLYFGGYTGEGAVLASQMRAAGLTEAIFFSDDGVFGTNFIKIAGKNAEGAYATSLVPATSPAKEKFDAQYKAAYGIEPGSLSPYSWNGYDSVAGLIHAIRQVAQVKDNKLYIPRGALVKAVRTIKDFPGVSGTITCDAHGECNTSGPTFYKVTDGKWVLAQ